MSMLGSAPPHRQLVHRSDELDDATRVLYVELACFHGKAGRRRQGTNEGLLLLHHPGRVVTDLLRRRDAADRQAIAIGGIGR